MIDVRVVKIKQYNSTYKHVLLVDGEPVCIAKGADKINDCIAYLSGRDVVINDGKIRKKLDELKK